MKKLNLAIVGYGGMGSYHGNNYLRENAKFEISGIFDIDASRYAAARENGIENYDRFHSKEEIAADASTDAVLIATPNDSHLEYVTFFAQAGKHIICEKPVALSSAEYAQMLEVCDKNKVVLMVHQNRRWDPDFLTVKKMYDKNALGKFCRIESRVQGANGIPGDWRKFEEKGGGMMLDWGVHLIDQMVYMLPELPESVYCRYFYGAGFEVDDGFRLEMNYNGGLSVEIAVDTNCFIPLPRWTVYGADGTAVKTPGSKIFPYIQKNLDDIITVEDDELVVAFLDMVENHKMIVENSGLLTVAALKHLDVSDKRVVSILSGGNMDVITMSSVVQQGLIFRDRIFTVSVLLPDKPGELSKVSAAIAAEQGNVIKLEHNQFVTTNRSAAVELRITLESFGTEHKKQIMKALEKKGYKPKLVRTSL